MVFLCFAGSTTKVALVAAPIITPRSLGVGGTVSRTHTFAPLLRGTTPLTTSVTSEDLPMALMVETVGKIGEEPQTSNVAFSHSYNNKFSTAVARE